jgi:uncharacterized protein (TIGR02145 family)
MKKLLFILSLSFSSVLFAQERNGITYQALIVDPSGEFLPGADNNYSPLKNTSVCLQFHIIDSTNSYEYSEQHTVTTDNFGMVNLVIGTGSAIGGVGWENVSWSASAKSLKVDVDKTGSCSSFEELSNQPLTSVPFALYSPGSDIPGPQGDPGEEGMSAYEVWLDLGNTGTEQDFIDSLKGPEGDPGDPGADGDSAYDVWIEAGNTGTEQEFLDSLIATDGSDGDSAYDTWIAAGNTGTEQEFLDSLKGPKGDTGEGNSMSGGIEDFGCFNTQQLERTNVATAALKIYEFESQSKHLRLNLNLDWNVGGGYSDIFIKCFDENDNQLVVFFDSKMLESKYASSGFGQDMTFVNTKELSTTSNVLFTKHTTPSSYESAITLIADIYSTENIIYKTQIEINSGDLTANPPTVGLVEMKEFICETPNIQFNNDVIITQEILNNESINIVNIGSQKWTQSNANISTYSDGTEIPQFTGTGEEWNNLTTGAWRYYEDNISNKSLGKFYNWYALQGIHDTDPNTPNKEFAPSGYRLPKSEDFKILVSYLSHNLFSLDGNTNQEIGYYTNTIAKVLFTDDPTHYWNTNQRETLFLEPYINVDQNNSSKLSFLPYRYLSTNGFSNGPGVMWVHTEIGEDKMYLSYNITSEYIDFILESDTGHTELYKFGFSVRLLKE